MHKSSNNNSDKKVNTPNKSEAELKEELSKMIEKHNKEMLKLL